MITTIIDGRPTQNPDYEEQEYNEAYPDDYYESMRDEKALEE